MTIKSRFTTSASVVGAMCYALTASVVMAQSTVKPWEVTCDDATSRCTSQAAVTTESGERVAVLGIQINKDGSGAVLYAATQLGVAVRPGVRMIGAGFETTLQFDICLKDGCRASTDLDAATLKQVLALTKVDLQMFPFGADAALSVPVPLEGLTTELSTQVTLPAQ